MAIRIAEHCKVELSQFWMDKSNPQTLSRPGLTIHFIIQAIRNLYTAPLTTIVTTFTISISLFIFGSFLLVFDNIKTLLSNTNSELSLSVYLKDGARKDEIDELLKKLKSSTETADVQYISASQALTEFRARLGDQSSILEGLDSDNPLPASIEIKLKPSLEIEERFQRLANDLSSKGYVDHVQYNKNLLSQFSGILRIFRLGGVISILVMLIVTGFLIANTIKLTVYSQRDEIEIMKLVGATKSFIRAPYLIGGIIEGFVACLISLVTLYGVFTLVRDAGSQSALLSGVINTIRFLSPPLFLMIFCTGIGMGVVGSYFAVRRFLSD